MRVILGIKVTKLCLSLTLLFVIALCIFKVLTRYKQDVYIHPNKVVADTRPGAVLSLYMYEQMGNGATNLMNLQCWAGSLNMQVVEPSIRESRLGGDGVFYFTQDYKTTKTFRDLFDFEQWDHYSNSRDYGPLISMETFLLKASRNIIYVELMYGSSVKCPQSVFDHVRSIFDNPHQIFKHLTIESFPVSFLSSQGFRIVRNVCINLLQDERLRTQAEFNQLIFGDLFGNGNYTIIFDEWRALRNESETEGKLGFVKPGLDHYRILVKDTHCTYESLKLQPHYQTWLDMHRNFSSSEPEPIEPDLELLKESKLGLIPSLFVSKNAASYRAKYLDDRPYLAVMMRMEVLREGISNRNIYHDCLNRVKKLWTFAMERYNLKQTFFSSDLGKYGSASWEFYSQWRHLPSGQFQQDLMHIIDKSSSYTDTVDSSFEDITHSNGRVEIAWTQSIVAANARCVIFLGGGAFQGLILNINGALHKDKECFVFMDKNCNEHAKLGFD